MPKFGEHGRYDLQPYKTVITHAELLHLQAAPKVIAPAPHAGFAVIPTAIYIVQDTRAGAYTLNGSNPHVQYDGAGYSLSLIITISLNQVRLDAFMAIADTDSGTLGDMDGKALILAAAGGGEFTDGDPANSLTVITWYYTLPATPG